jgi:hypothetical protein
LKSPQEDGPGKALTGRWIEEERIMKKCITQKTFTAKRGGRMDAKKCVFFFFTNYYTLI